MLRVGFFLALGFGFAAALARPVGIFAVARTVAIPRGVFVARTPAIRAPGPMLFGFGLAFFAGARLGI